MLLEISIDDGCRYDFRSVGLLEKYGLIEYSTFYIAPEHDNALSSEEIKVLGDLATIGGHTMTHALLTRLDEDARMEELIEGRKILQDITGQKVEMFCYPKGWYNPEVMRSVEKAGFKIGRTMKLGAKSLEGYSPFERPVTAHVYPRPEYGGDIAGSIIKMTDGEYFGLVFHSWEIEKFRLWGELDIILRYLHENKSS